METTLKSIITSFTKAIDLYNYLLKNHQRRTAIAAYYIGKEMELSDKEISDMVMAAAIHDIGAISVSERDKLIQMDVEDPYPHSRLGCYMLESFEPFQEVSRIVYYHHWPYERDLDWDAEKGKVPIEAYVVHVADRIEILMKDDDTILAHKNEIIEQIVSYKGTLFHPAVIDAFVTVAQRDSFWLDIVNLDMETILNKSIIKEFEVKMTLEKLEEYAYTLSKIIDTRSKFTISHSFGVSEVAYKIADLMDYPEEKKEYIKIAGLLHDMGKIAIAPEIIEKNGPLNTDERAEIQTHAYYTFLILREIKELDEICSWASNHHENHDGSGYPKSLHDKAITEEMDIIAYADVYTALSENRPYRESLSTQTIESILKEQFCNKHGAHICQLIVDHIEEVDMVCKNAIQKGEARFAHFEEMAQK